MGEILCSDINSLITFVFFKALHQLAGLFFKKHIDKL